MDAPENNWEHARDLVYPALRPAGTQGEPLLAFDSMAAAVEGKTHAQPLIDEGPAGLAVVYTLDAGAFDVIVNGEHLRAWGIAPAELQDAAVRNLSTWSASAPGPKWPLCARPRILAGPARVMIAISPSVYSRSKSANVERSETLSGHLFSISCR